MPIRTTLAVFGRCSSRHRHEYRSHRPFLSNRYIGYDAGYLAPTVKSQEKKTDTGSSASTQTNLSSFDTLGNPKSISVGGLSWSQTFNEAGDLTNVSLPSRRSRYSIAMAVAP